MLRKDGRLLARARLGDSRPSILHFLHAPFSQDRNRIGKELEHGSSEIVKPIGAPQRSLVSVSLAIFA
jgi:hypothetical protein